MGNCCSDECMRDVARYYTLPDIQTPTAFQKKAPKQEVEINDVKEICSEDEPAVADDEFKYIKPEETAETSEGDSLENLENLKNTQEENII